MEAVLSGEVSSRTESSPEVPVPVVQAAGAAVLWGSFGERNFGGAQLGDRRRTKRLVQVADALVRHPGGTLPEKLRDPGALEAVYHLMNCEEVTHASVLAPHRAWTHSKIVEHAGPVLVIHDTTELDFTKHYSLSDAGPIGNGSRKGWLCHNALVVSPGSREVLGLANQILHRRAKVRKGESQAARRKRADRESRLWLAGTEGLPSDRKVVDVCDRGADTFEFLEHEAASGRTCVIRSCYDRCARAGHRPVEPLPPEPMGRAQPTAAAGHAVATGPDVPALAPTPDTPRTRLHALARTLPALGQWTHHLPSARLEKKPTQKGSKTVTQRPARDAILHVAAAPVRVLAPQGRNGQHTHTPQSLWIVRVWEPHPPQGQDPLEWLILTNHPVTTFDEARTVVSWYECRWMIEEFHKAQKTGCGIQNPQFTTSARLHPMIALLSVVALSLLNLRELSRHPEAKTRPATDLVSHAYVTLLCHWRHHEDRPNWTIHDFFFALARLGGHQNRTHDHHPGWITLWRGWTHLQTMLDGTHSLKPTPPKCA